MDAKTRARIEAARARTLRGEILELLAEQSRPISASAILVFFERLHVDVTLAEIVAGLRYLKDRGYVAFEEKRSREHPGLPQIENAAITANGRDVVEGTTLDKGVDVG